MQIVEKSGCVRDLRLCKNNSNRQTYRKRWTDIIKTDRHGRADRQEAGRHISSLVTSQRNNKTQTRTPGTTHKTPTLFIHAASLCIHVPAVHIFSFNVCACPCIWLEQVREEVRPRFKGPLTKTGLAAPKAAAGMWGSTSVLWQSTHTPISS